jgi:hypothetical protein
MVDATEVVIDGVTYSRKVDDSPVKIAVLQRGFVYVGRWSREGDMCTLDDALNIRYWGSTKGLGELRAGPTSTTKIDPAGRVQFHILTMVHSLDCMEGHKWSL